MLSTTSTPRAWSSHEDALLRQAVAQYGDAPGTWKAIADCVPGRSNKSCRKRWLHSLSPTIRKTPWTSAEDAILLKLYHTHTPPRWSFIARHIPGRTDDACSKRYREALDPRLKKDGWTPDEDARLVELTAQLGSKWTQVGQAMGRSGLGCRNRWRLLQRQQRPRNTQEGTSHLPSIHLEHLPDMVGQSSSPLIRHPPPSSISIASSLSGALASTSQISSEPCREASPHLSIGPDLSDDTETAHIPSPEGSTTSRTQSPEPSGSSPVVVVVQAPDPSPVVAPSPPSRTGSDPEARVSESAIAPVRKRARLRGRPPVEITELPRLSSHLPADLDRTILPYACGHPVCWPGDTVCFATASELAEHYRAHPRNESHEDHDKPFRCALEGCGKGWKNINGIQYHLQISKAHFKTALSQTRAATDTAAASDATCEQSLHAHGKVAGTGRVKRKEHRCPHEGCNNSYKQRTGLQYHLAHGHAANVAQLDVIPPALMRKIRAVADALPGDAEGEKSSLTNERHSMTRGDD